MLSDICEIEYISNQSGIGRENSTQRSDNNKNFIQNAIYQEKHLNSDRLSNLEEKNQQAIHKC